MGSARAIGLLRQAILLAVAAVPALLVLVLLRHDQRADRHAQLEARLRQHAALLAADIDEVTQAGRPLGQTMLRLPALRALTPECGAALRDVLQDLVGYEALSVVDAAGHLLCAAPQPAVPQTAVAEPVVPGPIARRLALQTGAFAIGGFNPASGGRGPSLALALPFRSEDGRRATLVLSLSLDWLRRHLNGQPGGVPGAAIPTSPTSTPPAPAAFGTASLGAGPQSAVLLADAQGTILARVPDGAAFIGQKLPAAMRNHLAAPTAGLIAVEGLDGRRRLTAFSPAAGGRLLVVAAAPAPGLLAGVDRFGWQGGLAVAGGVLLSLWLLLVLSARLERRPAAALIEAARRWSAGDLAARVPLAQLRDGEYARLAAAFNTMAEALGRQRTELLELNTDLEARVAERTRDLVASRNQLQLEVVEHGKTEAELRQAQKLQAVGQLAGGIAHDFNNLLSGVTSALDLMRRRLPPGELALASTLETAMQAARSGARLTAQLLAFARRQRLLPAATDLNRLIADLPPLVEGTLGRDIAIRTELEPTLWPAFVDPGQLEAALLNLVFNARDAMPAGGTLTLSTANVMLPEDLPAGPSLAPGAYVAVRVADTGAGMPPEVLARVFEPFFTTKPPGGASGLGLSQVHGVALQSGGDVRIDSRPDAGTTVTLLLPRAVISADQPRGAAPRGLRILVADDDAAVRRMTGEILVERGHHPVLAADATQALAMLEKDKADTGGSFDVLLSDYVMPGTNGAALILMAQALQPQMHALLVTGHAEFGLSERLRPEHILRKPFTIAELDERLARLTRAPAAAAHEPP